MSTVDPRRVKELFLEVVDLPDDETRRARLDAVDPELKARVLALLEGHAAPASAVEKPFVVPEITGAYTPAPPSVKTDLSGTVIAGKYKLLQKIGEGGMGDVYMADQSHPVKRRVALKVIKAGMDSGRVLARFEAERQALALMDHPNIARVLDAGTTENNAPFFVMELVKGIPLTQFCDDHKLPINDRLNLFIQICSAVQHAHQKGIIHRDLKPTNILVESHDGKPVPKVIDFGLAKATSGISLTEHSLFTAFGTVAGTPLYMAPEQANFNAIDVDTRSDIYSLGVILYELLTGTTPIERETLKKKALEEVMRVVREDEPPTPSSRLSHSDSTASAAAVRGMEPLKLGRFVKGELDWIVMKALSKERERRYETANGFAKDVERFLNHEPVIAGPVTARYRLKKWVHRNKVAVLAASIIWAWTLLFVGFSTMQWLKARDAEKRAVESAGIAGDKQRDAEASAEKERQAKQEAIAQKTAAEKARDEKEEARRLEERERKYAQAIADFVRNDFLALTSVEGQDRFGGDGGNALTRDATLRQLLDRAAAKLDQRRDLAPDIEAELRWMIGVNYRGMGEAAKGIPHLERCVALRRETQGPDRPETQDAMNSLGLCYKAAGKLDLALPLLEETLKLTRARQGADHPDTLQGMNNLATVYQAVGKLDLAVPLNEETLKIRKAKLGIDHPNTLQSMGNLAIGYQAVGRLDLAMPLYEETLKIRKAKLGADHPDTLVSMHSLAFGYWAGGKLDLALPLWEETLQLRKAKLGTDHPATLTTMGNLAWGYQAAGKLDLALPILKETLKLKKAKLGADHPATLVSMNNLALGYLAAGKPDLALPLFQEAAAGIEKSNFQHEHAGRIVPNLIACHEMLEQFEQAEAWQRKWLGVVKERSGHDSPAYAGELAELGLNLLQRKKWADAEPTLRECLAIRERVLPDVWTTFNTCYLLGVSLLGQKKYADAQPLLLKGYEGMKQREKMIPPQGATRIPEALDRLIEFYTATNKPDEARKWQAERAKYPAEELPAPKTKSP